MVNYMHAQTYMHKHVQSADLSGANWMHAAAIFSLLHDNLSAFCVCFDIYLRANQFSVDWDKVQTCEFVFYFILFAEERVKLAQRPVEL